jgi:hypothetical protein
MMRVVMIAGLLTLEAVLPVTATIINVPGHSATIQAGINISNLKKHDFY